MFFAWEHERSSGHAVVLLLYVHFNIVSLFCGLCLGPLTKLHIAFVDSIRIGSQESSDELVTTSYKVVSSLQCCHLSSTFELHI